MAKIINISDKLSLDKPKIVIGDKEYDVSVGMNVVLEFEELLADSTTENMLKAVELALGVEAVAEIGVMTMSLENFKVLTIAILASMQDLEYADAEARFQKVEQQQG